MASSGVIGPVLAVLLKLAVVYITRIVRSYLDVLSGYLGNERLIICTTASFASVVVCNCAAMAG